MRPLRREPNCQFRVRWRLGRHIRFRVTDFLSLLTAGVVTRDDFVLADRDFSAVIEMPRGS